MALAGRREKATAVVGHTKKKATKAGHAAGQYKGLIRRAKEPANRIADYKKALRNANCSVNRAFSNARHPDKLYASVVKRHNAAKPVRRDNETAAAFTRRRNKWKARKPKRADYTIQKYNEMRSRGRKRTELKDGRTNEGAKKRLSERLYRVVVRGPGKCTKKSRLYHKKGSDEDKWRPKPKNAAAARRRSARREAAAPRRGTRARRGRDFLVPGQRKVTKA